MTGHESAVIMDGGGMDGHSRSEQEYDVVENLEMQEWHVPARPLNPDTTYADRDLPRSWLTNGLSAVSTHNVNIPPRKTPLTSGDRMNTGPAINRGLKPGRNQRSNRPTSPMPGLSLHKPCRTEHRVSKTEEHHPLTEGLCSAEGFLDRSDNQSHSLDLETCDRQRPTQRAVVHLQHKRPQSKDHHDFVHTEKPQQPCCKEEWYVGSCSRVDAEHALHLVNTNGAFLVRNCSVNTSSEPLVLAIYYEKRVYNIKIRFFEECNKYALGTGLRSKDVFDSVTDMIWFHSIFPMILVSGRNVAGNSQPESCVLTCPVTRRDVDLLLQ